MLTVGAPLGTVRSVRERTGIRGSLAWFRITREIAGRSGVRLERLSDKVHHPPKITSYSTAVTMLTSWEASCRELEKLEGQGLSEISKRTILKNMLPPDLVRDLERDPSL